MDELTSKYAALLEKYGEEWQISRQGQIWTAVRRPKPTALTVHVANSIEELRKKIEDDTDA